MHGADELDFIRGEDGDEDRVEIKSFRPREKTDTPEVAQPPCALEVRDQLLPEKFFKTRSEIETLTMEGDEPAIVKDFALAD